MKMFFTYPCCKDTGMDLHVGRNAPLMNRAITAYYAIKQPG